MKNEVDIAQNNPGLHMNAVLITGGAGFIGSNLANYLLSNGIRVRIFDDLSRKGTDKNFAWLKSKFNNLLQFYQRDIRDIVAVEEAVKDVDVVYHLAAQVAVTTSVLNPRLDFDINATGTLNVLEALRKQNPQAILIYSSTNKVYGGMEDLQIIDNGNRYAFADFPLGIAETRGLDFHSPYGCSKGAADQYIRDYARIYGLRTVVFRQSCIYGPRQFGNEDQGWLAYFIIAAVLNNPITIYGDGKQVRDLLYVDDIIDAFQLAVQNIDKSAGQVYNIGGGPENAISVWEEFGPLLSDITGKQIAVKYDKWRPGDQPVYISNILKITSEMGWSPKVSVKEGVEKLYKWVVDNVDLFI